MVEEDEVDSWVSFLSGQNHVTTDMIRSDKFHTFHWV